MAEPGGRATMSCMVQVRPVRADDLGAITAIMRHAVLSTNATFVLEPEPEALWRERWEETRDAYPWLAAVDPDGGRGPDQLIGYAKAAPYRKKGAYAWTTETTVYVRDGHQGKGVGSALLEALLTALEGQGFRNVVAIISLPNPASEALHRRFGMRRVGTFRRQGFKFGRWHDVAYYELLFGDGPPELTRPLSPR